MISKKAFEMQFNWIFVLVAGAAILLFFTSIIINQKSVSEISTKTIVLKNVEAIITGAGVSTGTTSTLDLPKSEIEVSCNRISLGEVSKQYQNLILFAPSLIEGSRLITQTLAFNAPFRATNLLFMSSTQVRYIIIGNNNLAIEVNRSLPIDMAKEFYQSAPSIDNTNNYKVRFAAFKFSIDDIPIPESLGKMPDQDVALMNVIGNEQKGIIEFYEKRGSHWLYKGALPYIGKTSLIAAFYTDTIDAYKCNMQNAFSRLSLVASIYLERTKGLIVQIPLTDKDIQCNLFYSNSLAHLNNILTASSDFTEASVNSISESAALLADENKNAEVNSCTLIY